MTTTRMTSDEAILYQRARDAFERGDFAAAEKTLLRVLGTHKEYADLYAMLGAICFDKGQFAEAIKLFAKALQINPAYTEAKVNLMVLFQDLGRYDRAKRVLAEIMQSSDALPQSPDPLSKNRLANLHSVTGDMYMAVDLFADAIQEYEAALEMRPGFTDIRLKLARALLSHGQWELAEMHCRTCLNSRPDDKEARVFLGTILMAQGRKTQALDAWKQVLALDPSNEDATTLLRGVDGRVRDTSAARSAE